MIRRYAQAILVLITVCSYSPVIAEPANVAERVIADIKALGAKNLIHDPVEFDEKSATIPNLSFEYQNPDGEHAKLFAQTVTLFNPIENERDGFAAEKIVVTGLLLSGEGVSIDVGTITLSSVIVPDLTTIKARVNNDKWPIQAARFEAIPLAISAGDAPTIAISSISFTTDRFLDDGAAQLIEFSAKEVVTPLEFFEQSPSTERLRALGYNELVTSISTRGEWDQETGNIALSPVSVTIDDFLSIDLDVRLGGYTKKHFDLLTGSVDNETRMLLVSQLTLANARIRLKNLSLIDRLLDDQARQTNTPREQIADQLAATLPLAMAALSNPAFSQKVSKAGREFLQDPQTLVLTLMPATPVPFGDIIGLVMARPDMLTEKLQINVVANP